MQRCTPKSLSGVLLVVVCLLGGLLPFLTTTAEAQTLATAAAADHTDYWEEDEQSSPLKPTPRTPHITAEDHQEAAETDAQSAAAPSRSNNTYVAPKSLLFQAISNAQPVREGVLLACVALYVISIFRGRRRNRNLATTWAKTYCDLDGHFDQQFARLGVSVEDNTTLLIRQSASSFLFYASGRRFCRSLTAHLDLRKRQDLLSYLVRLVSPRDDVLDIEVEMNEAAMPLTVLAIAAPRVIRSMAKDDNNKELELTHKVEISREKLPSWPVDKLTVLAEHSSVIYDLMPDQLIDQVFGKAAFDVHGQYFRSLLLSSERKDGHKHVIKFSFTLPQEQQMEQLACWMSAIVTFIDAVGTYKMGPELRKRAEKARSDLQHKVWKDTEKDRQQAMEERKEAKRKEEQEKLRKMDPDQREKAQQKKEKLQQKRAMKGKFIRV